MQIRQIALTSQTTAQSFTHSLQSHDNNTGKKKFGLKKGVDRVGPKGETRRNDGRSIITCQKAIVVHLENRTEKIALLSAEARCDGGER
ncbi:hypothetical protein GWI33_012035 [Rhynchophorus ferrugineus]|uniref:Uncharacterized protein n=1 Tax=Rhynchophorus ferrugineus TaxID=354439 RepID=A0A834I9H8_RHYFE|nr:hypothetical protein GWI33_012035 [Rhynchophorus ferrugineus]